MILGVGKRDVPYDVDAPIPLRAYRRDGSVADLNGRAAVTLGLSHPCTAFDKLRLIPLIDENQNVVDGVLTSF